MHMRTRLRKLTLFVSGAVASLLMMANVYAATNGVIAYPCRDSSGWQNICYINDNGTGKVQMTFVTRGAAGLPMELTPSNRTRNGLGKNILPG
jgi:hypothetical protein